MSSYDKKEEKKRGGKVDSNNEETLRRRRGLSPPGVVRSTGTYAIEKGKKGRKQLVHSIRHVLRRSNSREQRRGLWRAVPVFITTKKKGRPSSASPGHFSDPNAAKEL